MSKAKFFIYGGGRWREVDETGRVSGWAGSRFVYLKRGKLCVANRKAVVRGLNRLAGGRPSTVKVGLAVPQIKKEDFKTTKDEDSSKIPEGCHCCMHRSTACCEMDANFNKLLQPSTHSIAVQCNPTSEIATQVPSQNVLNDNEIMETSGPIRPKDGLNIQGTKQNYCKELLIDETDIELFRTFILNDALNIFNVDLLLYDANDDYKRQVFYKINPLVNIERDRRIQRMLDANNQMQQKQFAHILGLRSVTEPVSYHKYSKRKRMNDDKENTYRSQEADSVVINDKFFNRSDKDRASAVKVKKVLNSVNKLGEGSAKGRKVGVKKWSGTRAKTIRDYSSLEDDAIVSWILKNEKASFVNGNRIWQILQPIHHESTGHFRTWHSLRNRYLRYILPSLGTMAIPPALVSNLRAAASAGEIKGRKVSRRNSIFKTAQVRSAWTAKPKDQPQNEEERSTPRPIRLNKVHSPPGNKLPTYSEITRRFAMRHRSTPNSTESDKQTKNTKLERKIDAKLDLQQEKTDIIDRQIEKSTNAKQKIAIDGYDSESDVFKKSRHVVRHSRHARDIRRSSRHLNKSSSDEEPAPSKPRPENEKDRSNRNNSKSNENNINKSGNRDRSNDNKDSKSHKRKKDRDLNKDRSDYKNNSNDNRKDKHANVIIKDSEADSVERNPTRRQSRRYVSAGSTDRNIERKSSNAPSQIKESKNDSRNSRKFKENDQNTSKLQDDSGQNKSRVNVWRTLRRSVNGQFLKLSKSDKKAFGDNHSGDKNDKRNMSVAVKRVSPSESRKTSPTLDKNEEQSTTRSRSTRQGDRHKAEKIVSNERPTSGSRKSSRHNGPVNKPDLVRDSQNRHKHKETSNNSKVEGRKDNETKYGENLKSKSKNTTRMRVHNDGDRKVNGKQNKDKIDKEISSDDERNDRQTDRQPKRSQMNRSIIISSSDTDRHISKDADKETQSSNSEKSPKYKENHSNKSINRKVRRQSTDSDRQSDRQAKKPRITYEIESNYGSSDFVKDPLLIKRKSLDSSSSELEYKSRSSNRLKFEEDLSSSSIVTDESNRPTHRQTRSKMTDKVDRQKRTRRLYNPNAPI
ncbi:uncharacterized protein DDB_G0287625-like [Zerene cesonia]|uniref:uncharacterized protein DDB_G0287625-like n=1 Tax=Zerene cesonia TaxID=33412 RepID=UPI0018E572A9|nr:uncharacterized protein DDB_G0287625-like [Zerene cesonia]